MSVKVLALVFEAPLPPNEKIVMLALADYADDSGGNVRPSVDRLVVKTTMSRSTVRRMLDRLERGGYLVVEQKPRQHHPAHYQIDLSALHGILLSVSNLSTLPVVPISRVLNGGGSECSIRESRVLTSEHLSVSTDPSVNRRRGNGIVLTDDAFLAALKLNPAYQGIDIDRELGKLDAWLLTPRGRGKQRTRQRIVNWLNLADRPMVVSAPAAEAPWFGPNLG